MPVAEDVAGHKQSPRYWPWPERSDPGFGGARRVPLCSGGKWGCWEGFPEGL